MKMQRNFVKCSLLAVVCFTGYVFAAITSLDDAKAKFAQMYPNVFPPQKMSEASARAAAQKWVAYFAELKQWMANDLFEKKYGLLNQQISKANRDSLMAAVNKIERFGYEYREASGRWFARLAQWKQPSLLQADRSMETAKRLTGPEGELRGILTKYQAGIRDEDIPEAISAVTRTEILMDATNQPYTGYIASILKVVKESLRQKLQATDADKALTGEAWGKKMISYANPYPKIAPEITAFEARFAAMHAELKKELAASASDFDITKKFKEFLLIVASEIGNGMARDKKMMQS